MCIPCDANIVLQQQDLRTVGMGLQIVRERGYKHPRGAVLLLQRYTRRRHPNQLRNRLPMPLHGDRAGPERISARTVAPTR